jgi:hypothetical protein
VTDWRLCIRISTGIALALACFPTEPCACPPGRSAFIVYGRVVRADGTPSAGAHLRFDASDLRSEPAACDFATLPEPLEVSPRTVTDEAGNFRAKVYSVFGPATRCLRVTAFRGTPDSTDSVAVSGLIVEFRSETQPLDSLGLRLTLP